MCSRATQYKELATRYTRSYWRNPQFNTTRIILALIASLVQGCFYIGRGDNYDSVGSVQAILGSLFSSVIFLGFLNFQMCASSFL